MKITTSNIIELIEDYTNTTEVELNMLTKKNGDDYQVWDRSNPDTRPCDLQLLPDLPLDDVKWISFWYTSKDDAALVGMNSITLNEILSFNNHSRRKAFIKEYKIPQLEKELETHVKDENYDYAIRNRDFINHLKNKL